jgi:hypothetical protein
MSQVLAPAVFSNLIDLRQSFSSSSAGRYLNTCVNAMQLPRRSTEPFPASTQFLIVVTFYRKHIGEDRHSIGLKTRRELHQTCPTKNCAGSLRSPSDILFRSYNTNRCNFGCSIFGTFWNRRPVNCFNSWTTFTLVN